ncbi:hypothetical protein [Amycolatopsis sp. FDAARGOS 1241]|uniref:hypothetical protein n=1 Tax=Amycolatopsis sp. FDAARGOS 1241 TaxID=2778070 RepID=UPI00194FF8C7|nr:hypothetical protein [Amycolatopsis sp. FDAARGOS 1241]QRP45430.1 hypothetical protein I6J71_40875 [Amycolatopsis sp. FDAARGOS 1241]
MSFDLVVWSAADTEPKARYDRLADNEPDGVRQPQVAAFYRDLTAQYPELVDADDPERSPWNAGLSQFADAVVMPIARAHAEAVRRFVLDLARRHGLVAYDPQSGAVHHPGALTLTSCDGSHAENPDAIAIRRALERLSRTNWYAVLERGDSYVQVGQGKSAGAPARHYALEHRDGSPDRHHRTDVRSLDDVITAFTGFATGDPSWRQRFEWRKLDL